MIQPLKMNSSLNFQGNKTQEKPSLKNNITGFIKDINTVSNITGGVALRWITMVSTRWNICLQLMK